MKRGKNKGTQLSPMTFKGQTSGVVIAQDGMVNYIVDEGDLIKSLKQYRFGDTVLVNKAKARILTKTRIKATRLEHKHANYHKAWTISSSSQEIEYGVPIGTQLYFLMGGESPDIGDYVIGLYKNALGRVRGVVTNISKDVVYIKTDNNCIVGIQLIQVGYLVKNRNHVQGKNM